MKDSLPTTMFPPKTKLDSTLRFNVIILCLCGLLYGLLRLTQVLYDVFAIIGGALLLTYLLLGPVNTVEGMIRKLVRSIQERFQFKAPLKVSKILNLKIFEPIAHHINIRVISALTVYLCFFLVLSTTTLRILPILSTQVKEFSTDLPSYLSQMNDTLMSLSNSPGARMILENIETSPDVPAPKEPAEAVPPNPYETEPLETGPNSAETGAKTGGTEATAPGATHAEIISKNAIGQIVLYFQKFGPKAVHNLVEVATTTLEGMIYLIATLVIIFYLLLDGQKLKNGFIEFIPANMRDKANHFLESTHTILYTFIKGQIVLGFLAGFYMWLIFSLYGVKYAGFLGSFFGIASIVPVVGPWIGLLPGILVVLFSPEPGDLMGVVTLAGCFYLIKEYWLSRMVLGNVLEIHPVVFILAFLTCVKLAGPVGILLSFPVAALICVSIQYFQKDNSQIIQSE